MCVRIDVVPEPASIESARPEPVAKPKVIYVLGAGRSGSTILGVTLGNCENVFFAGELDKWLTTSGVPTLKDQERMGFWAEIRGEVKNAEPLFGNRARSLERSATLFQVRQWTARRRLRGEYRRVAEELYLAIAGATHATHIVDSSHYPLRALELQGLTGIDLYLIYLVRDPQSVVRSLHRKDVPERSFGTLATNAYLSLTHLFAVPVFLRHPRARRVFVRHEDFLACPEAALREILDDVDCSAAVPALGSLRTGVPLHGNRLVREQVVALEQERPRTQPRSLATSLLQLPWRLVFALLRPAVSRCARRPARGAGALATPPATP